MMQVMSLWLSYFSVMVICFVPMVAMHWFFVKKGISYKASIFVQKVLAISLLAIPIALFFLLSPSGSEENARLHANSGTSSMSIQSQVSSENAKSQVAPAQQKLSIADIWFPFVAMIFLSTVFGLLLFLGRVLSQELKLHRWQTGESVDGPFGVTIYKNDDIQVPFSVGVWRKRVFLPQSLRGLELEVIRRHELNHCLLNHHAWSLLEALQTHVFWFNPLAHVLRKTGNLLREIECDEHSTQGTDRLVYSKILLETAEKFALTGMMPIRGQGWNHTGGLRMRLNNLLEKKKVRKFAAWIGSFIAVAILSVTGTFYFAGRIDATTEAALLESVRGQYAQVQRSIESIELGKVPPHFIQALLAHEDDTFFEHKGVSLKAIVRATGKNLLSTVSGGPAVVQGGSTLTQQLAKQFLSEKERSLGRKFREYKMAHVLEANFSKNEILEMYLNMVYFGNQVTGLAQAAKYYYQTTYDQLSQEQSAMLIPFLDAPTKLNMLANPKVAEERQSQLLAKLQSSPK